MSIIDYIENNVKILTFKNHGDFFLFVGIAHPPTDLVKHTDFNDLTVDNLKNTDLSLVPIVYKHSKDEAGNILKQAIVGEVLSSSYDDKMGLYFTGVMDLKDPTAKRVFDYIHKYGSAQLSLSHDFDANINANGEIEETRRIREVSIVFEGQRKGCDIICGTIYRNNNDKNKKEEFYKFEQDNNKLSSGSEYLNSSVSNMSSAQAGTPPVNTPVAPNRDVVVPPQTQPTNAANNNTQQQQQQQQQQTAASNTTAPQQDISQDELVKYINTLPQDKLVEKFIAMVTSQKALMNEKEEMKKTIDGLKSMEKQKAFDAIDEMVKEIPDSNERETYRKVLKESLMKQMDAAPVEEKSATVNVFKTIADNFRQKTQQLQEVRTKYENYKRKHRSQNTAADDDIVSKYLGASNDFNSSTSYPPPKRQQTNMPAASNDDKGQRNDANSNAANIPAQDEPNTAKILRNMFKM